MMYQILSLNNVWSIYSNGQVIVSTTVPDTITSWIASAFAVSNVAGLGVSAETAKVTNIIVLVGYRCKMSYMVTLGC